MNNMPFLDKRVNVICNELKKLSAKQKVPIENWQYKRGYFVHPTDADTDSSTWQAFNSPRDHWYGPDCHYHFRTTFSVPDSFDGKPLWLYVVTQIDEWDDGKNPQFLLFVNGNAVQGIDMNHREVRLCNSAHAGEVLTLDLQAYTGTLHTEFNLITYAVEIDPAVMSLYYDILVPLEALPRMDAESRARIDIERILNDTVNLLDLRTPYSDEFYDSVKSAATYTKQAIYDNTEARSPVVATCIGHTHIDIAWWWTVAQTREKVARSFQTVLKLMDEYPDYKFMSSQPQLYVFLKERYPEIYEQIKVRVDEGRWEVEGGTWLECDTNLTSGESLVRQFLYGKRFFKDEFGKDCKILWLPDVFGYSGNLPQIMKGCGIDYFMTTKLAWNQFNQFPYDTFKWRGIDGSEVLTHLITTLDVGQPASNFFTTYNGCLHPDAIMGGWERYQQKNINNDILISFGHGDGGGGPTREMLETGQRMASGIEGVPTVRMETARTYFEELDSRVSDNKRLPVWEGELYFEYHRGTLTSAARNKLGNRRSELGLMVLEWLSILTKDILPYPTEDLESIWQTVMLNQFHDILPGSAIHEVYEVTDREYAEIAERLEALISERLKAIAVTHEDNNPHSLTYTIANAVGRNRDDIVNLGSFNEKSLKDDLGHIYPVQQTAEGALAYVEGVPSKGYATYTATDEVVADIPFSIKPNGIETPYYTVTIDESGCLTSIIDKRSNREIVATGKQSNLIRMYEDKPIYYDDWDIDIYYTEKYWDITDVTSMKWTEAGPVRAVLELERHASNSVIRQKVIFYARKPRIDFVTKVDWHEHQTLLKVHFPTTIHASEATFDIQFGNIRRGTTTNTSWDLARFESCGQKWADISEGHYGVSILNDCKYGYSVHDGDIALTLIKSGIEPDPTSGQELHEFTYALYPHAEGWQNGTVDEAYCLNLPLMAIPGGNARAYSLASVDSKNVVIETIKQAEDKNGIIIRLYECENAQTQATLTIDYPFTQAVKCSLLEEAQEKLVTTGNTIAIKLMPYEVATVRVI